MEIADITVDNVLRKFVVFEEFYQEVDFSVSRGPVWGQVIASIEEGLNGIDFKH